ncbi:tRNA/tmRNA/rRNA uracil-C5-methylase (TrmA/RlmC/RlmD family) [Trueperella bonasi]|uniref:tRNA/tmRNA/rRNA uracil-C5-methylase (TrmA/RlmC/RlmD family) n=1 Tax=Trueperella bonasi TaxID=312286 RepID=A0ABT9NE78_9ACTO|nr:hypothetical protein [Trueperella bonasi]MDP9805649.1 tRNA/tmRNA/rRNA uracil-C5-methylase (TrmA/RlmC/RlmD family) [Trueperella bonasi]
MIGKSVDVDIVDVAFGGETVGQFDGQQLFVRGAIIGERVRAEITNIRARGLLAITREVLKPAPTRIDHPWPLGSVYQTGAANYGHITLSGQREMKTRMLRRELREAGGEELLAQFSPPMLTVQAVDGNGWHYRTRIGVNKLPTGVGVNSGGTFVRVSELPLASKRLESLDLFGNAWDETLTTGEHLQLVAPNAGSPVIMSAGQAFFSPSERAPNTIWEIVNYRGRSYEYTLGTKGFWQVHENAPDALVAAVFDNLELDERTHFVDLYSGAGLFSLVAADLIGPRGSVRAYEGNSEAAEAASANFTAAPWASSHALTIDAHTLGSLVGSAQVVVADPPRAGLGSEAAKILALSPARQIALVSCDARSMARDVAALVRAGRRVTQFVALDIFPQTHFVETVCVVQ